MTRKAPATLDLKDDLDIFSIQGQCQSLKPRIPSGTGPLTLDLAQVGDLDLSGIQLILSLERSLKASGRSLRLTGLNPDWPARLEQLGLARLAGEVRP